jgi:hypothetical protein
MIHALVPAPVASGQSSSTPLLVMEQDGRVSAGSKERLRSAVQMGLPLRIGWSIDFDRDGKPDLSHWADAVFLTEFEGEVFAQIVEIRRQTPKRGAGHVELSETPQRWTGSIGSNGLLEGAFDDDQKPTRLRVRAIWRIDPRVPRENLPASTLRQQKGKRAASGKEVVVQLPEHIARRSYADLSGAAFESPAVMWRGLMSTDWTFDAVWVNRATGEEVRRFPQRVGLAWFAFLPPSTCSGQSPIELAAPDGVRRVGD